jgi:hypothetical protein
MREELLQGGFLVALTCGSGFGVEGVPNAHRGMIVQNAWAYAYDGQQARNEYRLTKRMFAGSDLWHVKRLGRVPA